MITVFFLHATFTDPSEHTIQWRTMPMQSMEACEIAASFVWENASEIYCTKELVAVVRPKARP